jgi:hypothetical protein
MENKLIGGGLVTDESVPLPWDDLRRMEGDLPWTALETFADAVVADPTLAQELFAEYDRAWQAVDVPTYVDLYVPAIFALAEPKLGDQQRCEIGGFLVDKLIEAGPQGADLTEAALLAACGTMGPIILPKVLDSLEAIPEASASWSRCWDLTALAAETADAAIRDRTVRACVRLLEQIEHGAIEEFLGISAAWTLALLKYADAAPLLQRLSEECSRLSGGADYQEAVEFLQGRPDLAPYEKAWERPVRQWLEGSWRMVRDRYARRKSERSMEEFEEAQRAREQSGYSLPEQMPLAPPIPIVEHSPRIGRNDPCPCGSGKKHKKCCGNPAKDHATNA